MMTDHLVTARDYFELDRVAALARVTERQAYLARMLGPRRKRARELGIDPDTILDDVNESAAPVIARVERGRWIADCPDCGATMFLLPAPEPFICGDCFNSAIGRRYRRVTWPRDIEQVETLLLRRAEPRTRGFDPRREQVKDLRRENREHGISDEVRDTVRGR